MAKSDSTAAAAADNPLPGKDLYEVGEIPPLGHVPSKMYAWTIRRERHGPPEQAMQVEVVPTWELDSHDVLVLVMAAGVNYNGVWAALGTPISVFDVHKVPYHIAGSDASGIVYAVGSKVTRWKVGDEGVIHCNQDDHDDPAHLGLRDAGRLLRAIRPRAVAAGDAAPQAPDLGRERLLHADARHRLSHALRPPSAYSRTRHERAGLGRVGRPRLLRRAALRDGGRACDRRHLG